MSCLSLLLAVSMHVGLEGNYNSVHPHVRCHVENTIAGVYANSDGNVSAYIGQKYGMLELGLVSGYVYPIVPMIRVVKNGWFISPAYERGNNWGVLFGYESKLF